MNITKRRQEQRQRVRNRFSGAILKTRYGWGRSYYPYNWSWGCRKCGGSFSDSGSNRAEVLVYLKEHDRIVHNIPE